MARFCEVFLLCLGSAVALRHGSQLADGQRTFAVSLDITGVPFGTESINVIMNHFHCATVVEGHTLVLSGLPEGQKLIVTDSNNVGSCWYVAGKETKDCHFSKWKASWASQEEHPAEPAPPEKEPGWKVMFLVDGSGPPFEIKIDNVTVQTKSGPLNDGTWWWMTDVTGAGVEVSMFVPSTNAECKYNVSRVKKTCSAAGWTIDFETMRSKEYDPYEVADEFGWSVHFRVEGAGPSFEMTANDVAFFEVAEQSKPGLWEQVAEIGTAGTPVGIRFENGAIIEYETGAAPDDFEMKGYKIHFNSTKNNGNA